MQIRKKKFLDQRVLPCKFDMSRCGVWQVKSSNKFKNYVEVEEKVKI